MINIDLQADIIFQSKRYSRFVGGIYDEQSTSPILNVYQQMRKPALLLISEAGQGKTTVVQLLQAELLYRNTCCHLFQCAELNPSDINFLDVSKDSVVIFDGWDEIPEYKLQGFVYAIAPLIQQSYKVIITSRYNPAASAKSDEEKSLFSDFDVAEICPFSKEQVATITGDLLDTDSRFYELLSNTMYLTMYLDLTNEERTAIFGVENAYQFIHSYFKLLFAKNTKRLIISIKSFAMQVNKFIVI